jgi:hypothetical protein
MLSLSKHSPLEVFDRLRLTYTGLPVVSVVQAYIINEAKEVQ